MEAFNKVCTFVQLFYYRVSDTCHDVHIKDNVNGIGYFNTDFCKLAAHNAHGIWNYIHGAAFH